MGVTLGADLRVELRWWWEDAAAGDPVDLRGPVAARAFASSLAARPDVAATLRSFLARGAPGHVAWPEARALVDRLATAIAAGHVRVTRVTATPLVTIGAVVEDGAPVAATPAAAPEPAAEPVCWPCLLAEASAAALRDAAADGSPFVAQD